MTRQILLSYISEEKNIAEFYRNVIKQEFFENLDVILSESGSKSSKTEFLIDNCFGAIYLLSPLGAERNNLVVPSDFQSVCFQSKENLLNEKPLIPCFIIQIGEMSSANFPKDLSDVCRVMSTSAKDLEQIFKRFQKVLSFPEYFGTNFKEFEEYSHYMEKEFVFARSFLKLFVAARLNVRNIKSVFATAKKLKESEEYLVINLEQTGDKKIIASLKSIVEKELKNFAKIDVWPNNKVHIVVSKEILLYSENYLFTLADRFIPNHDN